MILISISISAQQLEEVWATDAIFDTPESVLVDRQNNCLYVSNIGGKEPWVKDGNGFISKLGMDGKIIEKGKHAELISMNGTYKKLTDMQSFQ